MNQKKIALYFFGYSCTGKSSVERVIRTKFEGLYTVDYDVQKMQLSGYHRNKDRAYVRELDLGFFEVVCKTGRPVLLASTPLENEEDYQAYARIAAAHGYEFSAFEFTAERDVLIARYQARLDEYQRAGKGDSLKSAEEFLKTLDIPLYAPEGTVIFDTTNTIPEDIAADILKRVGQSMS